jgi:hypothetical protein
MWCSSEQIPIFLRTIMGADLQFEMIDNLGPYPVCGCECDTRANELTNAADVSVFRITTFQEINIEIF